MNFIFNLQNIIRIIRIYYYFKLNIYARNKDWFNT